VILAMTGWGQQEDRRRSREAGFDAHLVKPVEHETLLDVLASTARPPMPSEPPATGDRPH
jgi:CheY-like chemotaxis protein